VLINLIITTKQLNGKHYQHCKAVVFRTILQVCSSQRRPSVAGVCRASRTMRRQSQ
jgi:hypothetical protein